MNRGCFAYAVYISHLWSRNFFEYIHKRDRGRRCPVVLLNFCCNAENTSAHSNYTFSSGTGAFGTCVGSDWSRSSSRDHIYSVQCVMKRVLDRLFCTNMSRYRCVELHVRLLALHAKIDALRKLRQIHIRLQCLATRSESGAFVEQQLSQSY